MTNTNFRKKRLKKLFFTLFGDVFLILGSVTLAPIVYSEQSLNLTLGAILFLLISVMLRLISNE